MKIAIKDQTINFEEIQAASQQMGETGAKKHETIIFLHGWGGSTKSLFALSEMTDPKAKKIIIDLPGFGESSNPPSGWGIEEYSELVKDFSEKFTITKPILIGHSFGGSIALFLASKYPHFFEKIVVVAPSWKRNQRLSMSPTKKIIRNIVKPFLSLSPTLKRVAYKIFYPDSQLMAYEHLQENFKKIIAQDLSVNVKSITIPTLIMWGSDDQMTPVQNAHALHSLIPHSQLEIYNGYKHDLPKKFPEVIANKINEFLGLHSQGSL